ncbi:hypothetical protein BV22DRAFT_1105361 [Leucogyrophana mollusca]|uniref:Uncharacterized protein n=1 Tax=Leucogyrophana mollusca TaxID=85980 RepID=A0ACB8BII0_9AGAM|nr:hypothetical protein BV22DRAFT_1105361 [Leucogyrophana mollusca]
MIARCRAKSWVIQLKEESGNGIFPNTQRGMKGHVIVYPQQPSRLAEVLPPSIDELVTPICVVFVGSSPPTAEWLREKARPLVVRKENVRRALVWLTKHNRYYKDVRIDHAVLNELQDEQLLPVHVEHVLPNEAADSLTSRYEATSPVSASVVVTDVDGNAPANELRAAAIRHIQKKGGGYIEIPHGSTPVNEFFNPSLFPMIYPTLYPYGLGGFENPARTVKLSMKRHAKHFNITHFFSLFSMSCKGACLCYTPV